MRLTDLLMAQGVIPRHDVTAGIAGRFEVNDRKRTREVELSGPSKRNAAPTVKKEEISATARAQRIRDLQVSRSAKSLSISRT
jgi:hypothetical protein